MSNTTYTIEGKAPTSHNLRYTKACIILLLFLSTLLIGTIDFYVNMHKTGQDFKSKLERSKLGTFEDLRGDFNKILLAKSYERVKSKLQFLKNAEVIRNKGVPDVRLYSLDKSFLKIAVGPEILLFSLNDIVRAIRSAVGQEIAFDFHNLPESKYHLTDSIILIHSKLYLNYGINDSAFQDARNILLVNSFVKYVLLFALLAIINFCLIHFYRFKEGRALYEELAELKGDYSALSKGYKKVKAENALIGIVFAEERNTKKSENADINRLCEVLREYFSDSCANIAFQHHLAHNIALKMPESDLYLVCVSLIFYKTNLSKDAEFKIRFDIETCNLLIYIEDNGFILSEGKMVGYVENMDRPSFILEWWQILLKLKDHNIRYTRGNKGNVNFISLEVPLGALATVDNVICIDTLR